MEAVLSHYQAPSLPGLPPLHGGLVGYLGYDVVREVERLPDAPPDELGYPDAVVSVVGQIAAYDAWRQRVTLVEAVPVPAGATTRDVLGLYDWFSMALTSTSPSSTTGASGSSIFGWRGSSNSSRRYWWPLCSTRWAWSAPKPPRA